MYTAGMLAPTPPAGTSIGQVMLMVGGVYWEGEEKILAVVVVLLLVAFALEVVLVDEAVVPATVCFTGRVMARDWVEGGKGRGTPPALLAEGVVKVSVRG